MPKRSQFRLQRSVTHRLHTLSKLTDRATHQAYLNEAGIPLSEGRCLAAVGAFGPLSVNDLAGNANLNKGQASRAAQTLVEQGLVRKEAAATDGRGVVLSLTPAGSKVWGRLQRVIARRNDEIAACLSADELHTLGDMLDRLVCHARAQADGPGPPRASGPVARVAAAGPAPKRPVPMHHVFVYGTLKEGFANFGINAGQRVPGVFRTVRCYPLYILGQAWLPWLVNQPGRGQQVLGQVFQVTEQVLRDMDALEQVDDAGWYTRAHVLVQPLQAPAQPPVRAFVYFGAPGRLAQEPVHAGPLAEFTAQHNAAYLSAA